MIYHVRPRDLHAPGEHCNSYDCTSVVMKHEYDALAARLAEAVELLRSVHDNEQWYARRNRFLDGAADSASARKPRRRGKLRRIVRERLQK